MQRKSYSYVLSLGLIGGAGPSAVVRADVAEP